MFGVEPADALVAPEGGDAHRNKSHPDD